MAIAQHYCSVELYFMLVAPFLLFLRLLGAILNYELY